MSSTRAKEVFLEALDMPAEERREHVARACGDDDDLRREVDLLLRADAAAEQRATEELGEMGALRLFLGGPRKDRKPRVEPGQRVGPYLVGEKLGEGGFGIVYLAEQERPVRRRVALKVLRPGMDTGAVLARFEGEREALARMEHPGLCKVLDAGTTDDGRPYFAMEFFDGAPIARYCEERGLGLSERLRLFGAVCDAVQHAHQKGVVHRDLKPGNVLVATIDGRPTPKVIDFGIAKATDRPLTDSATLTLEGQFLGTPAYMSPEQAEGSGDIDTRSDIYSLGALLYELLCGLPPFDLREVALYEMLRRIREEDPPRPSRRLRATRSGGDTTGVRGVPDDLDWVVMRCLAKDRARRYPTASALHDDLERFLAWQPVEAAPPSRLYLLRKLARRHRLLVGASAAVALALVGGVAVAAHGLRSARRANAELSDALLLVEAEAAEARRQGRISEAALDFLNEDMLAAVAPSTEPGRGRAVTVREVLDEASRRLATEPETGARFAGEPAVEARLRETIGHVYFRLGLPDEAEPHLVRALELREMEHGRRAAPTLETANVLASVLRALGRYRECEELLARHVDLDADPAAAPDESTLAALRQVALLRQREGRHVEAAAMLEALLARASALLQPDSPELSELQNSLAVSCAALGRFEESERLFRAEYELLCRADGAEEPATLTAGLNLGAFLLERRRLSAAEEILVPVAEVTERVLGPDHLQTASAFLNLAIMRCEQGRHDESEALLEEVLAITEGELPEDHVERLRVLLHLARVHAGRGDSASAEALLLELRERAALALPVGHPLHSSVRMDLASLWYRLPHRQAELEELLRECLEHARRHRGPDAPGTLRAMVNLATWLDDQGRTEEAEALLLEALERGRAALGPEDPETLRTESDLALLYSESGRQEEALELAEHAALAAEGALDERSQELAVLRLRYGSCLLGSGRAEEAEEPIRRAREVLANARHPGDPLVRAAARRLAEVCEATGRPEAARLWREADEGGGDPD